MKFFWKGIEDIIARPRAESKAKEADEMDGIGREKYITITDAPLKYQKWLKCGDEGGNNNGALDSYEESRLAAREYCKDNANNCEEFLEYLENAHFFARSSEEKKEHEGFSAGAFLFLKMPGGAFSNPEIGVIHRHRSSLDGWILSGEYGKGLKIDLAHMNRWPVVREFPQVVHERLGNIDLAHPQYTNSLLLGFNAGYWIFDFFKVGLDFEYNSWRYEASNEYWVPGAGRAFNYISTRLMSFNFIELQYAHVFAVEQECPHVPYVDVYEEGKCTFPLLMAMLIDGKGGVSNLKYDEGSHVTNTGDVDKEELFSSTAPSFQVGAQLSLLLGGLSSENAKRTYGGLGPFVRGSYARFPADVDEWRMFIGAEFYVGTYTFWNLFSRR